MDNEYADYASFSTVVIDYDMDLVYKKAANELMRNWGYDPENCVQETFAEQYLDGFAEGRIEFK